MSGRLDRFARLQETPATGAAARARHPVAQARFEALQDAPATAPWGPLRTSAAFALRFDAEAASSGLSLDLQRGGGDGGVQVCVACGAQNGRFDTRCFNCRADLGTETQAAADQARRDEAKEQTWLEAVRAGLVPEARFARVVAGRGLPPRASGPPPPPSLARFARPAPPPPRATPSLGARLFGLFFEKDEG